MRILGGEGVKFPLFLPLRESDIFFMRLFYRVGRFRFRGINGVGFRAYKVIATKYYLF